MSTRPGCVEVFKVAVGECNVPTEVDPGGEVRYKLMIVNYSEEECEVTLCDPVPFMVSDRQFTVSASNGGATGQAAGSGDLKQDLVLPPQAWVEYDIRDTVSICAEGSVTNVGWFCKSDEKRPTQFCAEPMPICGTEQNGWRGHADQGEVMREFMPCDLPEIEWMRDRTDVGINLVSYLQLVEELAEAAGLEWAGFCNPPFPVGSPPADAPVEEEAP